MIQSDFHSVKGSEVKGPSGDHSDFVVESFDRAAGDFALGSKQIENQFPMGAQGPGGLLHGPNPTAQGAPSSVVQKDSGVTDRLVSPEVFKEVLERPARAVSSLVRSNRPNCVLALPLSPGCDGAAVSTAYF